jgi:hypothetical protein
MVRGDDGVWAYTTQPLHPGFREYWMIVDGTIMVDPNSDTGLGSHLSFPPGA